MYGNKMLEVIILGIVDARASNLREPTL